MGMQQRPMRGWECGAPSGVCPYIVPIRTVTHAKFHLFLRYKEICGNDNEYGWGGWGGARAGQWVRSADNQWNHGIGIYKYYEKCKNCSYRFARVLCFGRLQNQMKTIDDDLMTVEVDGYQVLGMTCFWEILINNYFWIFFAWMAALSDRAFLENTL